MIGAIELPAVLKGFRVHLVGIKGTGMTALAEALSARGAAVAYVCAGMTCRAPIGSAAELEAALAG